MKGLMMAVCVLIMVAHAGTRLVAEVQFDRNCGGYLKRAADANTVELATKNLEVCTSYLEANNMTKGYTSVMWTTPDEDVGFWYQNLTSSLAELKKVKADATQLEQSNVLMKLRETLLDDRDGGTRVTMPSGIEIFPQNAMFAAWGTLGLFGFFVFLAAVL